MKTAEALKPNTWIEIFEEPLTETKSEGKAKLISFIGSYTIDEKSWIERWYVKFQGESVTVERSIKCE